EAPCVLLQLEERPQDLQVYGQASRAMGAVDEDLLEEVLAQRGGGERDKQTGTIEARKRQRRDQDRVHGGRAGVLLGRETGVQMADLRAQARDDATRASGREARERRRRGEHVPCVDPVLDAPDGAVDLLLLDLFARYPREDQPFPGGEET